MDDQLLWVEKYRPRTIDDCILPDAIKNTFKQFVQSGNVQNLILSGPPGMGKTTVAKALCEEIGCDYITINGSDENGIDVLRTKIKVYASSVSLTGGRKVIIIDEADYLNPNSIQPALRGAIEEFSNNCSFIFTCNYKNRIIEPIHSRCSVIDFKVNGSKQKMAVQFMARVEQILTLEKIKYEKKVVAAFITKFFPDNRRILNELQRYSMGGAIDEGILTLISDVQISDLIQSMKEKNFGGVKKWVVSNLDNDSTMIFRKIYDSMYDYIKGSSIPQLVLILAKYQYQAAFSADQEINLIACMTEIMIDVEFK